MTPTRRRFLQAATCAAAVGSAGAGRLRAAEPEGCGLALGTYGLQALTLEAAIRLVGRTGYDAVEITAFPGTTGAPERLDAAHRAALRSLIDGEGLRLAALMAHVSASRDAAANRGSVERLRELAGLAGDLVSSKGPPPLIQTTLGGKDWGAERELLRDRVGEWSAAVHAEGGRLAIKPHRGNAMSRPEQAAWIIAEELGSAPGDGLGMVYDYSHYAFRELSIADTVAAALPLTTYVAVKDAVQGSGGKVEFRLPGTTGSWDHAEIFRRFYDGGYRGDFCIEVSSQIWKKDPAYDPEAATRSCYEAMSGAMARAGVPRRRRRR